MKGQRFERVISLGSHCGVAMELQRYGLREAAYPFDWLISRMPSVTHLLETEFEDLLADPSGLRIHPDFPHVVQDELSELDFYHDFDVASPLAPQCEAVAAKYRRRGRRLIKDPRPTLFVRYAVDAEDYAYTAQHAARIQSLLRRANPANELVLVVNTAIVTSLASAEPVFDLHGIAVYRVEIHESSVPRFACKNADLSRLLRTLKYPPSARLANTLVYIRRFAEAKRVQLSQGARKCLRPIASKVFGEARLKRMIAAVRRQGR